MAETKTIYKWWWVWDFDKEEDWLGRMAMEGWVLCRVRWCAYTFERCEPEEYTVRMEMRGSDADYLSFMEDTGAEYIGRVVQWIYFRRRSEYGAFELFSDMDSRITHLDKIARMLLAIGALNIFIGISNSLQNHLGSINLLCGCLLMYALGRIRGKAEALRRERTLRE